MEPPLTPEQRAVADQIEAEMRDSLERSLAPQSQQQIDLSIANQFRALGLPVVRARGELVGNEIVFDLTVAQPQGVG